ncbi:hypothetical protein [Neisseria iguanae]|uniref:hypothetical protein n=1 Tax=Neisseria iguanae TaxID=90242 RepID=UPI0014754465|nr:hypothetical protein [Neisseria iguanae]
MQPLSAAGSAEKTLHWVPVIFNAPDVVRHLGWVDYGLLLIGCLLSVLHLCR